MNLFAKYETDPQRERGGVEISIDGAVFVVRRAGGNNRRYRYALGRVAAMRYPEVFANMDDPDNRAKSEEVQDEIMQEAFADAVILGWRDVEGRDGMRLEFSRDAFLDLMRTCPDVWDQLRAAAIDVDRFRPQGNGHALGKS